MSWDADPSIPCKSITCPACGKAPYALKEVWEGHYIQFDYKDGLRGKDGWLGEGQPVAVFGECGCGNKWKLRGIDQITQLDKE